MLLRAGNSQELVIPTMPLQTLQRSAARGPHGLRGQAAPPLTTGPRSTRVLTSSVPGHGAHGQAAPASTLAGNGGVQSPSLGSIQHPRATLMDAEEPDIKRDLMLAALLAGRQSHEPTKKEPESAGAFMMFSPLRSAKRQGDGDGNSAYMDTLKQATSDIKVTTRVTTGDKANTMRLMRGAAQDAREKVLAARKQAQKGRGESKAPADAKAAPGGARRAHQGLGQFVPQAAARSRGKSRSRSKGRAKPRRVL